jgi:hypothetical protein
MIDHEAGRRLGGQVARFVLAQTATHLAISGS